MRKRNDEKKKKKTKREAITIFRFSSSASFYNTLIIDLFFLIVSWTINNQEKSIDNDRFVVQIKQIDFGDEEKIIGGVWT